MKVITRLHTLALASVLTLGFIGISNAQNNDDPGNGTFGELDCKFMDGKVVKQPKGSPIKACQYDDGATICDADWKNCEFDPAYKVAAGASNGLIKPQINQVTKVKRVTVKVKRNKKLGKQKVNRVNKVRRVTTKAKRSKKVKPSSLNKANRVTTKVIKVKRTKVKVKRSRRLVKLNKRKVIQRKNMGRKVK